MRIPAFLFGAALFLLPFLGQAAQTAQARLYCISVRLNPATDTYGDTLSVNSMGGIAAGAGELIQWGMLPQHEFDGYFPLLYTSVATLYDSTYDSTFVDGTFSVNLPEMVDDNNNGHPDFFETAQGIDTNAYNSSYHFGFPVGSGAIWTTWQRTAGSRTGICSLYLPDYLSTFNHTFEILEYTGSLSYTPGTNSVSATVDLKQSGATANTFKGTLKFVKSSSDRLNNLTLQSGSLSDASLQLHWFTNHVFLRNVSWPTNYAGFVEFDDDGTQNTASPYAFWVLSITDTNDANHDGVPDFSDDPSVVPPSGPRPPAISLTTTATNLVLRISGDVGHTHTVQRSPTLPANWQDVVSITLTNDPQVLALPFNGSSTFWRVFAR